MGAHNHVFDSSMVDGSSAWFDSDLVDFGRRPLIIDGAIGNRKGAGMNESTEQSRTQTVVIDKVREADPAKLRFLRWLAEQGRLEHEVFGPPSGEYAPKG